MKLCKYFEHTKEAFIMTMETKTLEAKTLTKGFALFKFSYWQNVLSIPDKVVALQHQVFLCFFSVLMN